MIREGDHLPGTHSTRPRFEILQGDVIAEIRKLPAGWIPCIVTSPPYWRLRDYGVTGQIGMEPTFAEFIAKMVEVFREVRRVLHSTGSVWINFYERILEREHVGDWSADPT